MHKTCLNPMTYLLGLLAFGCLSALPALSQVTQADRFFPPENFSPANQTLPNHQLNFENDSLESCCSKDYTADGKPNPYAKQNDPTADANTAPSTILKTDFTRSNPRYLENSTPAFLVTCERFADLPEQASNGNASRTSTNSLPITSYSSNVSIRPGAFYATESNKRHTSDFHVEASGGSSQLALKDVQSYSICMARGNNKAIISNTDNGSIMSYNGNDHILLTGNNTNMLTRTGSGDDIIEVVQADLTSSTASENLAPPASPSTWTAYNLYKTALSGGSGNDTLVIKGTPPGTKWCYIGGYRIYGEYFYVVEFALPPSVNLGPRRQRVNIGQSIEYVMIKGKQYQLNDFLVHGAPMDSVARSVPVGGVLPRIEIGGF